MNANEEPVYCLSYGEPVDALKRIFIISMAVVIPVRLTFSCFISRKVTIIWAPQSGTSATFASRRRGPTWESVGSVVSSPSGVQGGALAASDFLIIHSEP